MQPNSLSKISLVRLVTYNKLVTLEDFYKDGFIRNVSYLVALF